MSKQTEKRDTRRRFEQWAQNPNCQANTLSAVHGVSMASVAKAEGLKTSMGQSPFAIARGMTFERSLFRERAATLRKELERRSVLPLGSAGFVDLRARMNGGPFANLDTAQEKTSELLMSLVKPGRSDPTIVASPTLLIPSGVMLPEALLVIDVVVVQYGEPVTLVVGEVKTYPDRGGYTDTSELALARAQAGVYVHALRMVIAELGIANRIQVSDRGFLVLSQPGSNRPSLRSDEDLRYQAKRAGRGFEMLEAAAQQLPIRGLSDDSERILAVREAGTDYNERCIGFCDRAEGCRSRALERNSPAILGEDVVRLLGGMPLDRAEALMKGAIPTSLTESQVAEQLASLS